jgi:dihydropyrimidinase
MTAIRELDLVVRDATVVTADRRQVADIGVAGAEIAQLGGPMRGRRELPARGLYALPGGVDPHVHLTMDLPQAPDAPPGWIDDFASGSEAALAGGITSLGNMTFAALGTAMPEAIRLARGMVAAQASADVFLHPILAPFYRGATDDLARLAREGHRSLKIFMSMTEFERDLDGYLQAIRAAAALDMLVLLHCEDASIVHTCTAALVGRGCGLQHYAESRPPEAEVRAVERAVAIAEQTGARIYIVHLSSAGALQVCRAARARGLPVYVEARPIYLHLTSERYRSPDAALYVAQPPLREQADVEALWEGLRDGSIDTLGTDHAPWTIAQKLDPAHTLQQQRPGVPDLETMLPLLLSTALHRRDIPLERLVAVTATNPARLFGLWPRKGTIAVGGDADFALWDLGTTRPVDGARSRSRARYSPYEGMLCSAWPRFCVRRGEVMLAEGELLARAGSGETLSRTSPLAPL